MITPPSSLLRELKENEFSAIERNFNSNALRLGVVTKIHEIEDETNQSKVIVEYDVICMQQQGNFGSTPVIYNNCICFDGFGGQADYHRKKLRKSIDADYQENYKIEEQNGTIVLLLCLDAFSEKPIIIGSMPNANKQVLTKEKGLHLEGEYNGLNYQVNKDGEFTVTFKTATDNLGEPLDKESKAGGTFIKIDKTGSIDLNDGKTENIKIDKTEEQVDVNANKIINIASKTDAINVTAKKGLTQKCNEFTLTAEGTAKISVKSQFDIEAQAPLQIKAKQLQLEVESSSMIKTNQLLIEAQSSAIVNSPSITLGASPAPALVLSTQFLGVGNLGAPVISTAIGPFSSSVFVSL